MGLGEWFDPAAREYGLKVGFADTAGKDYPSDGALSR